MDLSQYKERFEKRRSKSRVYSEGQFVADEVFRFFGAAIPFGRIMAMIRDTGVVWVRECLEGVKKNNPRDRLSLFIHKVGQAKVAWKKEIKP